MILLLLRLRGLVLAGLLMLPVLPLAQVDGGVTDFTKIAHSGDELPLSAATGESGSDWACLRDNRTGLTWELKTIARGPRDQRWTYTPYDSNPLTNGGYPGYKDTTSGDCVRDAMEGRSCNTEAYVKLLRQKRLCGFDDWRLPTVSELVAVSGQTANSPPAKTDRLLPNTYSGWYWTGIETTGAASFSRVILLPPGASPRFYDGSYLVIGVRGADLSPGKPPQ